MEAAGAWCFHWHIAHIRRASQAERLGHRIGHSQPQRNTRFQYRAQYNREDYHPKGLEPKGLDPKGLEPKGSRVTDMGFVSGSPETVLLPRWSTFLVHTSFLSPKGAGLWTVDWQFQKEWIPIYRKQWAMPCGHAPSRRDRRYTSPRRTICLTCIVLSSV